MNRYYCFYCLIIGNSPGGERETDYLVNGTACCVFHAMHWYETQYALAEYEKRREVYWLAQGKEPQLPY